MPAPLGGTQDFDMAKYWGNLSPQYSVNSAVYGLPEASPLVPRGCEVVQVFTYFRHGARYPTTGAAPSSFAAKVHNASLVGFNATGDLAFLNTWTYQLGAELLTPCVCSSASVRTLLVPDTRRYTGSAGSRTSIGVRSRATLAPQAGTDVASVTQVWALVSYTASS